MWFWHSELLPLSRPIPLHIKGNAETVKHVFNSTCRHTPRHHTAIHSTLKQTNFNGPMNYCLSRKSIIYAEYLCCLQKKWKLLKFWGRVVTCCDAFKSRRKEGEAEEKEEEWDHYNKTTTSSDNECVCVWKLLTGVGGWECSIRHISHYYSTICSIVCICLVVCIWKSSTEHTLHR